MTLGMRPDCLVIFHFFGILGVARQKRPLSLFQRTNQRLADLAPIGSR